MAISSSTRKAGPFLGNDATTVFPFAFKVFTSADLRVVRTNALGVESDLVLDTDYTVALNSNQDNDPGGTVTRGTALPTGERLTITSGVEALQPLVLTNNGGFYPRVINDAFDKITIIAQQLIEQVGRSLKLPISSTASATLPDPVANRLIAWNSSANGFTNVDPASIATVAAYADANLELFTGNGTQTAFTLAQDPAVLANLDVSISGVTQVGGEDFTWIGTTLTFVVAPPNGTRIQVRYTRAIPPVDLAAAVAAAEADRVATAADRVQTGLDVIATAADVVSAEADRVATAADAVATAADRVQTGLDRTAASGSASAAAASATLAAAQTDYSLLTAEASPVGTDLMGVYRADLKKLTLTNLAAFVVQTATAFLSAGTGAVSRTVQSKLRDWSDARDFGGVTDGTTQQTVVQNLLNNIPTRGSLPVMVPPGVKFDPDALTFPRRSHLLYFKEDSTTTPGYFAGGSGELVWHMQNSSYRAAGDDGLGNGVTGGEVNEVRFTSNFHPGLVIDVQKSVGGRSGYLGPGQDLLDPARASLNFLDDGNGCYRHVYQNGLAYSSFHGFSQGGWYRRIRLTGVGTAQWVTAVPAVGTVVTGVTSGARGHVVVVEAGYTDLELFDGRFSASETVSTAANGATAATATITYSELPLSSLSVCLSTGAHSIGDRPPCVGSEMLNVAGRTRIVPSRGGGAFVSPKTVTKPAILLGESEEDANAHALGIQYDPSEKADTTRRLRIVTQALPTSTPVSMGEIVPVSALAVFGDAAIPSNNWSNIASITNSSTGNYDIVYTTAITAAYGAAQVSVEAFYMGGWSAAVTFFATTGCTVRVYDATQTLADIPAGGQVAFTMFGGDVI